MSVLAKLRKANAVADQEPQPPQKPLVVQRPKREIPAAREWSPKRTLGRPRNQFAKYHLQQHPVADFVNACLQPAPSCSEFIGEIRCRSVKTVDGRAAKIKTDYPRMTLASAYIQYCVEHCYLPTLPRTFSALIIKTCLENGWMVRYTRAGDSRRQVIQGILIKGQEPFYGTDDRLLEGHVDRQRWLRSS